MQWHKGIHYLINKPNKIILVTERETGKSIKYTYINNLLNLNSGTKLITSYAEMGKNVLWRFIKGDVVNSV